MTLVSVLEIGLLIDILAFGFQVSTLNQKQIGTCLFEMKQAVLSGQSVHYTWW